MIAFHYDDVAHRYTLENGRVLPHITGMLKSCGHIDDRWYTEESSERGTAVHKMTADYDLGALALEDCVSIFRGYLLGHAKAMGIMKPEIHSVEEPRVHQTFLYGGRLDRVITVYRQRTVLELKTAVPDPSHEIQTALQAILASDEYALPAEHWQRLCLYLKPNGSFKLIPHNKSRDFDEARRIIRRCCS